MGLVVLPAVSERFRSALLNLPDYRDIPTDQLKRIARQLPVGSRVHLLDRVTTIASIGAIRHNEYPCFRRSEATPNIIMPFFVEGFTVRRLSWVTLESFLSAESSKPRP